LRTYDATRPLFCNQWNFNAAPDFVGRLDRFGCQFHSACLPLGNKSGACVIFSGIQVAEDIKVHDLRIIQGLDVN